MVLFSMKINNIASTSLYLNKHSMRRPIVEQLDVFQCVRGGQSIHFGSKSLMQVEADNPSDVYSPLNSEWWRRGLKGENIALYGVVDQVLASALRDPVKQERPINIGVIGLGDYCQEPFCYLASLYEHLFTEANGAERKWERNQPNTGEALLTCVGKKPNLSERVRLDVFDAQDESELLGRITQELRVGDIDATSTLLKPEILPYGSSAFRRLETLSDVSRRKQTQWVWNVIPEIRRFMEDSIKSESSRMDCLIQNKCRSLAQERTGQYDILAYNNVYYYLQKEGNLPAYVFWQVLKMVKLGGILITDPRPESKNQRATMRFLKSKGVIQEIGTSTGVYQKLKQQNVMLEESFKAKFPSTRWEFLDN
jgi:hypothetical protein